MDIKLRKKKVVKSSRKEFIKGVLFLTIFTLIVGGRWYYRYNDLLKNAKYEIATMTRTGSSKGYKKEFYYKFNVGRKVYTGYISDYIFHRMKNEINVIGSKYLVVYSVKNPKTNVLVENKPIVDRINIDSLNVVGVDREDWSWNDL